MSSRVSFDLLLQIEKQIRVEELLNINPQPITQFLDCRDGRAVVSPAYDVVHGGLGHTTSGT